MTARRHRPAASRVRASFGQRLTRTERAVIAWAAAGTSVAHTAMFMFLSPNTVETHRKNAYRKLGVRNAVQASRKLYEQS